MFITLNIFYFDSVIYVYINLNKTYILIQKSKKVQEKLNLYFFFDKLLSWDMNHQGVVILISSFLQRVVINKICDVSTLFAWNFWIVTHRGHVAVYLLSTELCLNIKVFVLTFVYFHVIIWIIQCVIVQKSHIVACHLFNREILFFWLTINVDININSIWNH